MPRVFSLSVELNIPDHPPYSPDLARCNFWLFPKLKDALKGRRFDEISDIQHQVAKELKNIPDDLFQECFEQQTHRLTNCIDAQGDYFEGDSSRLFTGTQR
jgi:hypothetical protein